VDRSIHGFFALEQGSPNVGPRAKSGPQSISSGPRSYFIWSQRHFAKKENNTNFLILQNTTHRKTSI